MTSEIYNDLAKIVEGTRKIESFLDELGGEGKGLWEKADSLNEKLPSGIADRILCVALVRNKAMHGSAQIDDVHLYMREIAFIDKLLFLHLVVENKMDRLVDMGPKAISSGIFDRFLTWSSKVKVIVSDQRKYGFESIVPLYEESEEILKEVDVLSKKYNFKKAIFFNTVFVSSVALLAYVLWRYHS